jgi:general stress protein 26
MTNDDEARVPDTLMKPGSTLMVGTQVHGRLEFRPLTVARIQGSRIDVLLDSNEEWVRAFDNGERVEVTMGDNRENVWVGASGTARCVHDESLIDELWNPFADAYFDNGRQTPGIAVFEIDLERGRYWTTTSGRLGSLISAVKAKLGGPEDSGEHGDLATN